MQSFWEKTIILVFSLISILISIRCSSDKITSLKTEKKHLPFGNWYTQNRHMYFQSKSRYLLDTTTSDSKNQIDKYYINSITIKPHHSYLLRLTQEGQGNVHILRYFVMDQNFESMREFNGEQVIYWTRTP